MAETRWWKLDGGNNATGIMQMEVYSPVNRGGPAEIRTLDPQLARLVLYQLSYRPTIKEQFATHAFHLQIWAVPKICIGTHLVGQGRLELPTSRLSGVYSNQLSYWPPCVARGGK